ncbi:M20/M25/M40 family metallo-hydrolase [Pyxidicoccus sp. MSG2]|uniref:M20/M25/M40 family metallo-hydrolase n=1 Tax=Pyxidicoccus sp. MSG2 TaxID=2996790 RepID=UPI00226E4C24|nr:M20/M25/M40 family metallo-hydrolase [Pyxidicoccus sp. MSG2]MCY1017100.1 M20/M25/M40 family metallo-hydrolase [Pyxidicoccus sp. MSG2]
MKRCLLPCLVLVACATPPSSVPTVEPVATSSPLPQEVRLADLRQLTFGGENAEAYWSFDGTQLSLQARHEGMGCDRIYRMAIDPAGAKPTVTPVSSGQGATTCSHFLPGDQELIYASTHLGGEACPPRPDHSMGYVWALYDTYDIFKTRADGTGELARLTETKGYDAEGTVCAKDGSIIFTSVRDGDLELYRMDRDGKNVRRLTNTPGYDGGAFFNADCTKIVWRASRPHAGKELEDYQGLLARGLVRPTKLELYVANADGSEAKQITWLNAASFAPFFHPNGRRILFSSNYGDPKGREFDIWAVDVDGSNLERITHAPGFDGFPMFSPDGKWLAFSSNRATAPGKSDTNLFLARWVDDAKPVTEATATDRIKQDVTFLAAPEREGRGIGTTGLEAAGQHIEQRFQSLGLSPAGDGGTFRQVFPVTTAVKPGAGTQVTLGGTQVPADAYTVLGFSAQGVAQGPLVFAGYGIVEPSLKVDDYAKQSVKGKLVVVRRFVPDTATFSDTDKQRRFGDLRYKAWVAAQRGAKALLVVDWPEAPTPPQKDWQLPSEASLPGLSPEGHGDAGIPVVVVKRAALAPLMDALTRGKRVEARVETRLDFEKRDAFNVVGLLSAGEGKLPGAIVIGAHYDHLGLGGRFSLAPDRHEPHGGADDNASGVAGLLEIARTLAEQRTKLQRDVFFVAFSGEETGVLGSTYFTRQRGDAGMKDIAAMLNLDMVGRLRSGGLTVLGAESAGEWGPLISAACEQARVPCSPSGDGYGPSDHSPFYAAGVPVLHFFTGAHSDYHKPSDTVDTLNVAGTERVARIVSTVALSLDGKTALTYRKVPSPAPRGDMRSFNASLGTVPDYAGPPEGQKGMLLAGVRAGGAADQAGMKRGDILVRLGKSVIGGVEDLMFVLNTSKPGETVRAVVLRDGKEVPLEVTFQESKRPR